MTMFLVRVKIPLSVHTTYSLHKFVHNVMRNPEDPCKQRDFLFRDNGDGTVTITSSMSPLKTDAIVSLREFQPKFRKGAAYHFSLVANPVVKKSHQRKRLFIRGEAPQLNWLSEQLASAGHVERSWIKSVGKCMVEKPMPGHADVIIGKVEYEGILVCENPDELESLVCNGVGHAKGFGFGMILLRQVS